MVGAYRSIDLPVPFNITKAILVEFKQNIYFIPKQKDNLVFWKCSHGHINLPFLENQLLGPIYPRVHKLYYFPTKRVLVHVLRFVCTSSC